MLSVDLLNKDSVISYFNNLNNDMTHHNNRDDICTPMECVFKMIDHIPNELWKRNGIRILDPCCGNGNFAAGLTFYTSQENIYLSDINNKRLENCQSIFKKSHVKNYDFFSLEFDIDPEFNKGFDLIIANPPYSGGGNKNQSLSNKFIERSIDLLNNKGYLCFITPNNWMSYNHKNTTLKKLLNEGSFIVIDNDAKKFFPAVGSSFTIFIWQKNSNKKTKIINNFLIKDIQNNVQIPKNLNFIPLYISQPIINVINKTMTFEENGITYRCDLHNFTKRDCLSDVQTDVFKYPTIHTARKTRYATFKQDIYDKFIIIIPLSTYFIPYITTNRNTTQSVCYLPCNSNNEAKTYLNKLNNKIYKVLIHITRYGNFNNIMVIKHLNLNLEKVVYSNEEMQCLEMLNSKIKY